MVSTSLASASREPSSERAQSRSVSPSEGSTECSSFSSSTHMPKQLQQQQQQASEPSGPAIIIHNMRIHEINVGTVPIQSSSRQFAGNNENVVQTFLEQKLRNL